MRSIINVAFFEPYPMGLGGNFLTQRLILERLDRNRFYPIVLSPVEGIALGRFRSMGVECVVMPPPGALGRYGGAVLKDGIWDRFGSVFDLIRYNLQMARFFRIRKIDVVYANCVRAQMSVGIGSILAGVPLLLYVKGELANPVIDRLSFLLASKILFFSRQNRDDQYPWFVKFHKNKIDILRIGLDIASIDVVQHRDQKKLRDELGIDSACLNIAVVAQLYRPKGQHFAIDAISRLINEFPNLHLYLIGDHVIEEYRAYQAELEAQIERLGLTRHVHFTGWRLDALDIVRLMDVVVHPSLAEGFGRAVLEAMALGKPVIASAVGGLREAIRDGQNGCLVSPGDVDAIACRLRGLLSSSELRNQLGQAARQTVFSEYLIDDKVSRLAEIWTEMAL